ncbi:DinB family protein [Hymenobacter gummosus]|uniref:DinB family protein n=1 Tax=Hymenobacter gummosus TaxID=1776032 RepID=A0A3S0HCH1_9BACT|nr:DinB family protein [Hymenobacter gummosus]RTQ53462.1 DinB family protein [Hymenobacter gummosus]
MNLPTELARHQRAVYFGGNWTSVNLQATLADVSWREATTLRPGFNTIAALLYHVDYHTGAVLGGLRGGPLTAKDAYTFNLPPVQSAGDWDALRQQAGRQAESLAALIEQLPESRLDEDLTDPKHGSYYRNLQGLVEHAHHLGQMVLLKKLLRPAGPS